MKWFLAGLSLGIIITGIFFITAQAQKNTPGALAQGGVPPVTNIQVRNGSNLGEGILSWDAVPQATHYRIGYVNMEVDYHLASASCTGEWIDAFVYVDVDARNIPVRNGRAEYTVRRLAPGARHAFTVLTSNNFTDSGHGGSVRSEFFWPSNPRWKFLAGRSDLPPGVALPAGECTAVASSTPGPASDRAALVALYNATDGPNWANNRNWLSEAPIGEWHSVNTDRNGHVTELHLSRNRLSGTIPAELGNLAGLRVLNMGDNQLTGGIPAELGNLGDLQYMRLSYNQLSGEIPAELGNLSNLEQLEIVGNQLTGPIPAELGNLTNLGNLRLYRNKLTGPIPQTLGDLSDMGTLHLNDNRLIGEVPAGLGNLVNVVAITLDDNQLTGKIPAELGSLARLETLRLNRNRLTGEIPAELGNLVNLRYLSLRNNQLTGEIPAELVNLINLERLYLSGNQLTGCLHEVWQYLNYSDLSSLELPVCDQTSTMSQSADRATLVALYHATGGPDWQSSSNWLSEAPVGFWRGVTVDRNGRVIGLDLSGNQLTGEIPAELGSLARLETLRLDRNQLTGEIPAELGNLSNLEQLYLGWNELTGEVPEELGSLARLETLRLDRNQLTGEIPAELGNLVNLTRLDFSGNELTGEIPAELGNLANLWRLDLSGNLLVGQIPANLSHLKRLNQLGLRGNKLTGQVPAELSGLSNLRSLDIRDNQLTGKIPESFGDLQHLHWLWLSHNQFMGHIPPVLERLTGLAVLRLNHNRLGGCIPNALVMVANHDLASLGLPLCMPENGSVYGSRSSQQDQPGAVPMPQNVKCVLSDAIPSGSFIMAELTFDNISVSRYNGIRLQGYYYKWFVRGVTFDGRIEKHGYEHPFEGTSLSTRKQDLPISASVASDYKLYVSDFVPVKCSYVE